MSSLIEFNHPIIKEKLGLLRNKDTPSDSFRSNMRELGKLLAYEVLRDFEVKTSSTNTPLTEAKISKISELPVVVSIMRAGNILMEGLLELMPDARCGHLGIYRDKFINNTVEYYFRLPKDVEGASVFLLDPMVATGKTAEASIARLKQCGVGKIHFISLLISKSASEYLSKVYPDVQIYCAGVESELDDSGLLVPGIGDVGGRLYGPN